MEQEKFLLTEIVQYAHGQRSENLRNVSQLLARGALLVGHGSVPVQFSVALRSTALVRVP